MAKRVSLIKVLRRELGSFLADQGFAEVPQEKSEQTHILLFFREASNDKSLGFWFQRDVKAYKVDALGSSFTLEFFKSLEKCFDFGHRERIFFLLTPEEREEMRVLLNKMVSRLPPLEQFMTAREIKSWDEEFLTKYTQPTDEPFTPGIDRWMRYRDAEDLLAWTIFIKRLFPSLVDRFLSTKGK
jgi:hypothetical protein